MSQTAGPAAYLSWLYGATLLLSALLLFWIQPLFTRMALPFFGGAPAVWTTAAMFFQFALLAGYLYAHVLSRALEFRRQVLVHLTLLVLVCFRLPVSIGEAAGAAAEAPIAALLNLLVGGLGLPFFAIAATAPLLQGWFSRTRHADASDPYFLYVASNVGCLFALVGYPLAIEPALGLARQTFVWTAGYALVALLIGACALSAWRHRDTARAADAEPGEAIPAIAWRERAAWLLLALAPVSLMLGVTQHITSEIAAVPLLWLVPLALYVATFVNAFARRPPVRLEWSVRLQPLLVIALALVWMLNVYFSVFALHLLTFFVTALMCHGELARRRPPAAQLTEFYLWIALGGALGGAFSALAAPLVFDSITEYPLAIALACMLRPAGPSGPAFKWLDLALPAILAAAFFLLVRAGVHPLRLGPAVIVLYVEALGVLLYLLHARPLRFGLAVAATLLAMRPLHDVDDVLARQRSFFGVHTVLRDETRQFNVLLHGITVHGAQHLNPSLRYQPTTFYHRHGPLGQVFEALGAGGRFRNVALVGLGTGSAVCHREAGRVWTIYEIDPVVVAIVRDPRWFDFLAGCAPDSRIVIGDGRLSLARAPDRAYDLIILDTFSSDAIPIHMVTREAVALYFRKLSERGVLMIHISNQHLDLAPVLSKIAADLGFAALIPGPRLPVAFDGPFSQLESDWIAIARGPGDLRPLAAEEGWHSPAPSPSVRPWTDDYSNILQALK